MTMTCWSILGAKTPLRCLHTSLREATSYLSLSQGSAILSYSSFGSLAGSKDFSLLAAMVNGEALPKERGGRMTKVEGTPQSPRILRNGECAANMGTLGRGLHAHETDSRTTNSAIVYATCGWFTSDGVGLVQAVTSLL